MWNNQWLIDYQIPLIVIARQLKFQRLWALLATSFILTYKYSFRLSWKINRPKCKSLVLTQIQIQNQIRRQNPFTCISLAMRSRWERISPRVKVPRTFLQKNNHFTSITLLHCFQFQDFHLIFIDISKHTATFFIIFFWSQIWLEDQTLSLIAMP